MTSYRIISKKYFCDVITSVLYDAKIRVIGLMEPEICTRMLKKLSEKLRAKFPATTHGYSVVKFARLVEAFLEVFFNFKQAQ